MSEGASVATANSVLSAGVQGVSYATTGLWVQLHVGAPGSAGTANIATETTRMDASACFGTAPSGGSITNDATIGPWTSVTGSETYTHFTTWSASSGGTFGFSGTVTAAAVTVGDDFDMPAGVATITLPVAA